MSFLSTRHGGGPDPLWDMIIFSVLGGILLVVLLLVIAGIVHALWTGHDIYP